MTPNDPMKWNPCLLQAMLNTDETGDDAKAVLYAGYQILPALILGTGPISLQCTEEWKPMLSLMCDKFGYCWEWVFSGKEDAFGHRWGTAVLRKA